MESVDHPIHPSCLLACCRRRKGDDGDDDTVENFRGFEQRGKSKSASIRDTPGDNLSLRKSNAKYDGQNNATKLMFNFSLFFSLPVLLIMLTYSKAY